MRLKLRKTLESSSESAIYAHLSGVRLKKDVHTITHWSIEGPNPWAIMYVQWFQRRSFETVRPGRKLSCKAKKAEGRAKHATTCGVETHAPRLPHAGPRRDTRVVRPAFTPFLI